MEHTITAPSVRRCVGLRGKRRVEKNKNEARNKSKGNRGEKRYIPTAHNNNNNNSGSGRQRERVPIKKSSFFHPNLTNFLAKWLRKISSPLLLAATAAAPFRLEQNKKGPGVPNEFDNVIMVAIVIMCHAQQPTADPHRKQKHFSPLFFCFFFFLYLLKNKVRAVYIEFLFFSPRTKIKEEIAFIRSFTFCCCCYRLDDDDDVKHCAVRVSTIFHLKNS